MYIILLIIIINHSKKTKGKDITCLNEENSCKKSLCECDAAFAKNHVEAHTIFNEVM